MYYNSGAGGCKVEPKGIEPLSAANLLLWNYVRRWSLASSVGQQHSLDREESSYVCCLPRASRLSWLYGISKSITPTAVTWSVLQRMLGALRLRGYLRSHRDELGSVVSVEVEIEVVDRFGFELLRMFSSCTPYRL